jgi:DNA-binding FrmR family transcriptional regulator
MATDAKENQQPQTIEERLARVEEQVGALAKWCENNTEILKALNALVEVNTAAIQVHQRVFDELVRNAPAPPTN